MNNEQHIKRLIKGCLKNDRSAQRQLYALYVKQMYNVSFRIVNNRFDAEDATQEAFIKAFQKIKSYRGDSSFGAWLKRIVVNHSLGIIRKRDHTIFSFHEFSNEQFYLEEEETITADVQLQTIMKAIGNLPDGARIVFTLKAIENYKHYEIAKELGISLNNSKAQYFRAKKLLYDELKNKILIDVN